MGKERQVRIPDDLVDKVEELAKDEKRSFAQMVRILVDLAIQHREEQKKS